MELVPCVNDALEISSLQRSATNQTTVDVGLCKKFGSVAGLAASAIEDAGVVCHLSAVNLSHTAADVSVDFLCLFRSCSKTCTDSPNWFVSDNEFAEVFSRKVEY